MKRILCALLSVACLFHVTPAHARLIEVAPKFTYARVSGSQIPDSTEVWGGATATSGKADKIDTTAWVDVRAAAFNDVGRNGIVAAPDSILGIRVILTAIDDPAGDGTFSVSGADSQIVTIQGLPFTPNTVNPAAQAGTVALFANDRQDHSSAGCKYINLTTAVKVNVGAHAAITAGLLTGCAAVRVILKEDNTQPQTLAAGGSRWRVRVEYLTTSDSVIQPTGSR